MTDASAEKHGKRRRRRRRTPGRVRRVHKLYMAHTAGSKPPPALPPPHTLGFCVPVHQSTHAHTDADSAYARVGRLGIG